DLVHRRRQHRYVQLNLAGEEGARVGLARQDRGFERLKEHVVERQSERNISGVGELGHIGPWQQSSDSPRGGQPCARSSTRFAASTCIRSIISLPNRSAPPSKAATSAFARSISAAPGAK